MNGTKNGETAETQAPQAREPRRRSWLRTAPGATEGAVAWSADLRRVLERVADGRVRIPQLNRPRSWTAEDVRALLGTVLKGLPAGTLTTWVTDTRPGYRKSVGPVPVEADRDGGWTEYVIDGGERLGALYGVLADWQETGDEAPPEAKPDCFGITGAPVCGVWRWYLDLDSGTFVSGEEACSHHLLRETLLFPLRGLLDDGAFGAACARIGGDDGISGWEKEERLETAAEVRRGFGAYRLHGLRLHGVSAAEAFSTGLLLNTTGRHAGDRLR